MINLSPQVRSSADHSVRHVVYDSALSLIPRKAETPVLCKIFDPVCEAVRFSASSQIRSSSLAQVKAQLP